MFELGKAWALVFSFPWFRRALCRLFSSLTPLFPLVAAAIAANATTASGKAHAGAIESIPDSQWRTASDVVTFQPYGEITGPMSLAGSSTQVRWINLNTHANIWFLLEIQVPGQSRVTLNFENPTPLQQTLSFGADGKVTFIGGQSIEDCVLVSKDGTSGPALSALGKDPYMSLCGGRLYLRNRTNGRKDAISWATTSLREMFGDAGDDLVNAVKETIYDGKFFEAGQEKRASDDKVIDEGGPEAAQVSDNIAVAKHGIGIKLVDQAQGGLKIGQWYKARNFDGLFASVMKANYVAKKILQTYTDRVDPIDSHGGGEGDALVNSVAIDLSRYTFGWNNGTEHPGVGWSPRARGRSGPGPDGFGNLNPLALPGLVNPSQVGKTIGTIAGGFQRLHSAFKAGPLNGVNRSSHYGFMEKGVLMSTIVPQLATFIVYLDGSVELKTWTLADDARLSQMKDIRQNGVPLLESDPAGGTGIPHPLVNNWGFGNWSGSANKQLKTPRTSACILERGGKRFLMVSYFSTHTPSGMARVLQAYQCKYAIHLDMNHPRFAYSAFFTPTSDGDFEIEHLSNTMTDDVLVNGKRAPRSLLTPTYKDFFYVMKK